MVDQVHLTKKSVRGGGTLLSRTVKADKDEDDFEGTAYKRVNDMLHGMDAGELTAHVGNGHYIYTFSTTDHQENDFTSGGSIGVYTLTKTKQGWHLGRISGDIRGDFTGGWSPQFTNQANLTYFARYTNMGHNAPDDVDFPQFEPGGKFKEWMKSDFEDFKNFPLSKDEAAVERPAVKNYYNSAMSTYNRYAPKGKYPETASREVRNRYEQKESQAYRKTLAAMVRKGLNKETRAAKYIDRYRFNWHE